MITELLTKVNEADFADIFKPAEKDELVTKRGWALLNSERSEVELLKDYDDVLRYSKLDENTFNSKYRQGFNFYGVRDKISGDTFIVTVSLQKRLQVYDSKGNSTEYFME